MHHEVDVFLIQERPGISPMLLSLTHGYANLLFEVTGPEVLAQWLAFLFQHGDPPDAESAPEELAVGRYGSDRVTFSMGGEAMLLVMSPEGIGRKLGPCVTLFIPRELLNDLADGLAREHRRWVEKLAA